MSTASRRLEALRPLEIDVEGRRPPAVTLGRIYIRSSLDVNHPATEHILFTSNVQSLYSQAATVMKTLPRMIKIHNIENINKVVDGLDIVVDVLDHQISRMGNQIVHLNETVEIERVMDIGAYWEETVKIDFPEVTIEEFIQMVQALVVDPLERGAGNRNIASVISLSFDAWVESQVSWTSSKRRIAGEQWLIEYPIQYDDFRRHYVNQVERVRILQQLYEQLQSRFTPIHLTKSTREYRFPLRGAISLLDIFNALQTHDDIPLIIYHELDETDTQPIYKVDSRLTDFDPKWILEHTSMSKDFEHSIVSIISTGHVRKEDPPINPLTKVQYGQLLNELPELLMSESPDQSNLGIAMWRIDENLRDLVIRINIKEPFDPNTYLHNIQTPALRQLLDAPVNKLMDIPDPKDKDLNAVFLFPWKDVRFKIIYDLILNDPLTNWAFDVDERTKSVGIRTETAKGIKVNKRLRDGNYVVVLDPYDNRKRVATLLITPKYMQPRDPLWKTYVEAVGGSDEKALAESDLTPMAPYLHVSVFRANDMQSVQFAQKALALMLTRYGEVFDAVWSTYCGMWTTGKGGWYRWIEKAARTRRADAEELAAREQEIGSSRINQLRAIEPDLFVKSYSCVCMKASLPRIVDDPAEQATLRAAGKQLLVFPAPGSRKDVRSHTYVCDGAEFPYPSLRNNTAENRELYPLIPCCAIENQLTKATSELRVYLSELGVLDDEYDSVSTSTVRRGARATNIIITNKSLGQGRYGELPNGVKDVFTGIEPRRVLRRGVGGSLADTFISAIQYCIRAQYARNTLGRDSSYVQFMEAPPSRVREHILRDKLYWADAQSMAHLSEDQIRQRLADNNFYLSPRQWIRTMEAVFKVQIVAFRRDRTCPINGDIIIPENTNGYWMYNMTPDKPTIFILEHEGADPLISGNRIVCEPIVVTNKTGRNTEQSMFTGNIVTWMQSLLNNVVVRIQSSMTSGGPERMQPVPSKPISNLPIINKIIGQQLDQYGRMRALLVTVTDYHEPILIVTEPLPPMAIPRLEGTVSFPTFSNDLYKLISSLSTSVGFQVDDGIVSGVYIKLQDILLYVPIKPIRMAIGEEFWLMPTEFPVYIPYQVSMATGVTFDANGHSQFIGGRSQNSWFDAVATGVTFSRRYVHWWLKWLAMKLTSINGLATAVESDHNMRQVLTRLFNVQGAFIWKDSPNEVTQTLSKMIQHSQYPDKTVFAKLPWVATLDSKAKLMSTARLHRTSLEEYVGRSNVAQFVEQPYEIQQYSPHSIILHGDDSLLSFIETRWDKKKHDILTLRDMTLQRLLKVTPWIIMTPEIFGKKPYIVQSLPALEDLGITFSAEGQILLKGIDTRTIPGLTTVVPVVDDEETESDLPVKKPRTSKAESRISRGERPRIGTLQRIQKGDDIKSERPNILHQLEFKLAIYVSQYWKDHRINIGTRLGYKHLTEILRVNIRDKSLGYFKISEFPANQPLSVDQLMYASANTAADAIPEHVVIQTPGGRIIPLLAF